MANWLRAERRIGTRTFAAFYSDANEEPLVRHLFDAIETLAREGAALRPGETFGFLGMVFSLVEENGGMVLARPVLHGEPIFGTERSIGPLLKLVFRQLELARQLGLNPEECRVYDKVLLEEGSLNARRIWLQRSPVDLDDHDSGWFLAAEGSENDKPISAVWIWQLLRAKPEFADVLALPVGFSAIFDGTHLEAILDEQGRPLTPPRSAK